MLDLLRSLEWQAGYNGHACPSCRACEVDGHTPTCALAAAIRALEAPGFKGRQPGERVETDSAATWVVSIGDVRRKGEPTVDEMAREMGLEFRDGQYDGVVDGDAVEVYFASEKYPPGPPVWLMWGDRMSRHPDVGDALRAIYREHKAKPLPTKESE